MSDEQLLANVPVVVAPCATILDSGTPGMHRPATIRADREVTHAR